MSRAVIVSNGLAFCHFFRGRKPVAFFCRMDVAKSDLLVSAARAVWLLIEACSFSLWSFKVDLLMSALGSAAAIGRMIDRPFI
ncbi:hypothetical protein JMF94_13800 [Desulfovibrio sp. UIB00]|nr:hypothetical protein [Desulfovibrio sp. UIB00]